MTAIYFALIILPLLFIFIMAFVFSSSLKTINQHLTVLNCPFPVNSGIANLTLTQSPPQINYTVTSDSTTDVYHVTIFECRIDPNSSGASINTKVYTADVSNAWFAMTNRASGYMFYISECIDTIVMKLTTFGNLAWLVFNAPAVVTNMIWFTYVNIVLLVFVALGLFMIARGH